MTPESSQIRHGQIKELRLARGKLFSYFCPDCKQSNGGGVDNKETREWRRRDKYSPLNRPCIWCGKGPMVQVFCNPKRLKNRRKIVTP